MEQKRKYTKNLRGNQDIFLADVMNSPEFKAVRDEHLSKNRYFTGLLHLQGKLSDDSTSKAVEGCAEKISSLFRIKKDIAIRLLLSHNTTLVIDLDYSPKVSSDDNYVYLRIGPKTSQQDVLSMWKLIKDEQRKLGKKIGSKSSINSELAFCIHRELVLKDRKLKDIYRDYQNQCLEGYDHQATIDDIDDFRKYYKRATAGLLIG